MLKKLWQWVKDHEGLILLVLLSLVLRIPSLYEPYWYGDEGIYLVLGQALKKGLVFYRDIHDNKPPLLYFMASLTGTVFWFRWLLMIWMAITVMVFFKLASVLFPKKRGAWYLSSFLMILLTTLFEGNIANAEIFQVLLVSIGMLLVYGESLKKKKKRMKYLIAGLMMALAFLLKVPAVFDLGAIGLWLLVFEREKAVEIVKGFIDKRLWLIGLGFLVPVGLSILYYFKAGAGERYLRSALMQNIGYLGSWSTGKHTSSGFSSQSGLLIRTEVLGGLLLGFYLMAKKFKLSSGLKLTGVWFLMALYGALLSERPYPHYLIQPAVPAALLAGYFWFRKKRGVKLIVLSMGLLAAVSFYKIRFWHYPLIPYYKNFFEYKMNKKSLTEYRRYFDARVNQSYAVAEYIREHSTPNQRLFIWGDEPYIYALAERLPIGKYTVAYHVVDFNGYEETIEAWEKHRPILVVLMKYERREFPEMMTRLATDYIKVEEIEQAEIYMRLNGIKNEDN